MKNVRVCRLVCSYTVRIWTVTNVADVSLRMYDCSRYERDVEPNPNMFFHHDFERHIGEIASFQLDKYVC